VLHVVIGAADWGLLEAIVLACGLHDGAIVLAQIWVHSAMRREGLASAPTRRDQ
jgi:hypothetical protein